MSTRVVVVGGGIVGCAVAYFAAREGMHVTLLEQREIGYGASGRNPGFVWLHCRNPGFGLQISRAGRRLYDELARDLPEPFEFRAEGGLFYFNTPDQGRVFEEFVAARQTDGLDIELIDGADVRRLVGPIRPDVLGASFCAEDAQINTPTVLRALAAGARAEGNPFVYVSSGPWNLYDLLVEAFRLHGVPPGPLLLRDWGISRQEVLPTRHRNHKLAAIQRALELWPHLPFLLVGDSGQHDPEIYEEVTRTHPQRVLAVYIRQAGRDPQRPAGVRALAEKLRATGKSLLLAPTAWELAEHAAAEGWIVRDALPSIAAELGRDMQAVPLPPA